MTSLAQKHKKSSPPSANSGNSTPYPAALLIDSEFRSLIPPLDPAELAGLKQSLIREGNRDPIVIWEETQLLLDGHNRYDICIKNNIPLKSPLELSFPDRDAAAVWIIDNQLSRRNLPPYPRILLAKKRENYIRAKAKEKQKEGGVNKVLQNSGEPLRTDKEIAKLAKVSHDTVWKVKKIEAEATPEQKLKLATGEASINEIYKRVERISREQDAIKRAANLPDIINPNCDLRHGDFVEALSSVPSNTVDLIFTDPPYEEEYLNLWRSLGEFASRTLKPGGLLVAYSGQTYLPSVMSMLGEKLEYYWLGALVIRDGPRLSIFPKHIWATIKPLLFYQKPPASKPSWFADSFIDHNGARNHEWQQTIEAPLYFIEALTKPGDIVLDPFLGSGTTAIATVKLGRHFIGSEINESIFAIAKERIDKELNSNVPGN